MAEAVTTLVSLRDRSGFPAKLAKDKRLCNSMAEVLLSRLHQAAEAVVGGPQPDGFDWRGTAMLARAILSEPLGPARQQLLEGSSMAVMGSTAQLILQAPPDLGSPNYGTKDLANGHMALARLLQAACLAQLPRQSAGEQLAEQPIQQHERTVQLLLPMLPKFGPALQLAMRAATPDATLLSELCTVWSNLLQSFAGAAMSAEQRAAVAAQEAAARPATLVPAPSFCSAATAMLQLLPLLQQADQLLRQAYVQRVENPMSEARCAAADWLARICCNIAADAAERDLAAAGGGQQAAAATASPAWELASCASKLALWAMDGSPRADLVTWPVLLLRVSARTLEAVANTCWRSRAAASLEPPPPHFRWVA